MKKGIFLAVFAAALYAVNAPLSKVLLAYLPPHAHGGFFVLGRGAGNGVNRGGWKGDKA